MKQRLIPTIKALAFFALVLVLWVAPVSAQQPTPTLPASVYPPTADLERRIYQLETAQSQTIDSLKASNQSNHSLIMLIGALMAVLVAIQGFATGVHLYREGRRDKREAGREEKRDLAELLGVEQVSKIMAVVQQTLEGRRIAEEKAREDAAKAQEELAQVINKVQTVDRFFRVFQTNIQKTRLALEETASRWAREVSRHGFRRMTGELNDFARRLDQFKSDSEPLEEDRRVFSARVPYIRGIAAHYANHPGTAKEYLTDVVGRQEPESGEDKIAYTRRVANAYYYLGVTESNFGNDQDAIDYFKNANERDLQNRDFLTRIVTAEAAMMIQDWDTANRLMIDVEHRLEEMARTEGRLAIVHLRLQSRAALVRANMGIVRRENQWRGAAQRLLEPVHAKDPKYYYATTTLAQARGDHDPVSAKNLFGEAYQEILSSDDLHTVTEVRSRILLLMVAAMCAKHGPGEDEEAERYLDEAESLRGSLPKIGSDTCTVFSTLSKRNEHSETIHDHIEVIRSGKVVLESIS